MTIDDARTRRLLELPRYTVVDGKDVDLEPHPEGDWVCWDDLAAVLDTEGDRQEPADVVQEMRSMGYPMHQSKIADTEGDRPENDTTLPSAADVLGILKSDTEGDRQTSQKIAELEWVLARAEDIVAYEHGKDAAYAFTQAWGELPKELATPVADTEGDPPTPRPHDPHLVQSLARGFASEWLRPDAPEAADDNLVTKLTTVMVAFYACTSQAIARRMPLPDPPVQP
jgi:hypothetical protein